MTNWDAFVRIPARLTKPLQGCGSGSLSQVQRRYRTDGRDGAEYIPLFLSPGPGSSLRGLGRSTRRE